MNTNQQITKQNVDKESYYNAVRLCTLTGYANAPAAIKALNLVVNVRRDKNGNIAAIQH